MSRKVTLRLFGDKGDLLSLMPLTATVRGLILTDFEYPLDNETLERAPPEGSVMCLLKTYCSINLDQGKLLVKVIHSCS